MSHRVRGSRAALITSTAFCSASLLWNSAFAQQIAAPDAVDEIVVVGSQIVGAKVTAALPVTIIAKEQIEAVAAGSGDELFRTIPQAGNVTFNASSIPGSSNSARGDVNSIGLRNLGNGSTLVLLNGRRTVRHPTTQGDFGVPTFTYNTNAIPVAGVQSLEVLRDGAAAIYGTDAVAGVINTVLQTNYDGAQLETQYGGAVDTHMREFRVNGIFGRGFAGDRGHITIFGSRDSRTALLASDTAYTRSADRRPLFEGTEWAGSTSLDGRSTSSAFGVFQLPTSVGVVRSNGVAVTGSTGIFHYAPKANPTCGVEVSPGLCIDANGLSTTADRNLRVDTGTFSTNAIPKAERYNVFGTLTYELTDQIKAFSEFGYYQANTVNVLSSPGVSSSTAFALIVPANAYYNPFGATLLANGQPNPNRLPGLSSNVPAGGLPVTINAYNLMDLGTLDVRVKNEQYRFLAGLKGKAAGWNWESAALYSAATADDQQEALSSAKIQAAIAGTTADSYNPFNGGSLSNPSTGGDPTPSSAAALNNLLVIQRRYNKTTLALADFKVSRSDILSIWSGDVGMAAGLEIRRETYQDDRDSRLDGTITFTNPYTGISSPTDLLNTSVNPDVKGKRVVMSAFAELAIPLVSPEMNIPLVDRIEVQIAGRAERYDDVGSVAKPKVAAAWDIVPGVRMRGSWSQGFNAPNLEVINISQLSRSNTRPDYIFCEANLRQRTITSFNNCSQNRGTRAVRKGNPDLKPETSDSLSYGLVLQPTFIPPEFGRLTATVDVWRIRQKGLIGLFGEGNALILDYLLRLQGNTNPLVHRLTPTPDDIAQFTGTGLAPAGIVDYVDDQYVNLSPQVAAGIDFGLNYRLLTDSLGDFSFNMDVSKLGKQYSSPSPGVAELIAARTAGKINAGTAILGAAELVGQNGTPAWRGSGSASWRYSGFTVTWFSNYIGKFYDTGLTQANGDYFNVKATVTHNLSLAYQFDDDRWNIDSLKGLRLLLGVRNITDKEMPLAPTGNGQSAMAVYNPYGRYVYLNVRKTF